MLRIFNVPKFSKSEQHIKNNQSRKLFPSDDQGFTRQEFGDLRLVPKGLTSTSQNLQPTLSLYGDHTSNLNRDPGLDSQGDRIISPTTTLEMT